ncbi:DUF1549 domain-containing protein [Rubinisphaera italica]|nr:DUF1549 domain-containing protein [Rubinisphaera italica]
MLPDERLPETVIADFTRWIQDGAFNPRDQQPSPTDAAEAAWKAKLAERSRWWSLQPLKEVSVPKVIDPHWSSDIDCFIFNRLKREGLSPASRADPNTLLRRLSFVLTGLPPSPEETISFQQAYANSPEAALELTMG